jgi:hypothetical protein
VNSLRPSLITNIPDTIIAPHEAIETVSEVLVIIAAAAKSK